MKSYETRKDIPNQRPEKRPDQKQDPRAKHDKLSIKPITRTEARKKFSPGNQKEDDTQPHKTEWEYSVSQHQGMQKRGKLLKKGTPIVHADQMEANEGPTRQSS